MTKIAIVDDQEIFLNSISKFIKDFYCQKGIPCEIREYDKADLLIYDIKDNLFCDVYFLDIEMPKINGLHLAEFIRKADQEAIIVFITLHMEFAIDAYDVNAYQYVPKTLLGKKLPSILTGIQRKIELNTEKYFVIETNTRYEKILLKNIYYIYKSGKNVYIVTTNGESYIRETLDRVYDQLDHEEFFYVNRGCIVNIIHIMKLNCNDMYLRNQKVLPVSRTHIKQVKKNIHSYWKEHV